MLNPIPSQKYFVPPWHILGGFCHIHLAPASLIAQKQNYLTIYFSFKLKKANSHKMDRDTR
jgi:hypothetical protein